MEYKILNLEGKGSEKCSSSWGTQEMPRDISCDSLAAIRTNESVMDSES